MQHRCSHCGGLLEGKKSIEAIYTVDLGGSIGKTPTRVCVYQRACNRCGVWETRKRYRPVSSPHTWKWEEVHVLEIHDG